MSLKILMVAGGLLAFLAAGVAALFKRRSDRITTDGVSGDWLAQARAREEQQW
jgi:hypothetical protein